MSYTAIPSNDGENVWVERSKQIKTAVIENFLLFSFAIAVLFALSFPAPGILFHSWKIGEFSIFELLNYTVVFFISGFTLKLEELKSVLQYKIPIFYSLLTINFVTTLLGFVLIKFPYLIGDFQIGETIFASVPTTLGDDF